LNRMKRIYVCCILLILVFALAAFYGVFTGSGGAVAGSGGAEGFQTRATPPASIKCTRTDKAASGKTHTYWFCDDKNHADALMEEGVDAEMKNTYVLPAESICIKGSGSSYTCLDRDRKDRRYLLNRQRKAICDFVVKGRKDVDYTVGKANDLKKIAGDALETIDSTRPDIAKLKEKNSSLGGFLDEQSGKIEQQKGILSAFVANINDKTDKTTALRTTFLDSTIQKFGC